MRVLELLPNHFAQFIHLARQRLALRLRASGRCRRRTLDLRRFFHDGVVPELRNLVLVELLARELLLPLHLLLEIHWFTSRMMPIVRSPREAPDSMAMSSSPEPRQA